VSESNAVCGARCCVPAGHGGQGGHGGAGGQVGQGGAGGVGGAASPCSVIAKLDRACLSNDDCFSARHTSNCCGQITFLGLNVAGKATYNANEPACDASYPLCECATLPPLLDDGSRIRSDQTPAVACVNGICTTFVKDCEGPCGTGKTCFTCGNRNGLFAACTTSCGTSADCADTSLPHCQSAQSGNVAGMFCTPASVLCDSK